MNDDGPPSTDPSPSPDLRNPPSTTLGDSSWPGDAAYQVEYGNRFVPLERHVEMPNLPSKAKTGIVLGVKAAPLVIRLNTGQVGDHHPRKSR